MAVCPSHGVATRQAAWRERRAESATAARPTTLTDGILVNVVCGTQRVFVSIGREAAFRLHPAYHSSCSPRLLLPVDVSSSGIVVPVTRHHIL